MDTNKNKEVIGFVGAYAYDLILYLAGVLQLYDMQTLAVDHNPDHTLQRIVAEREVMERADIERSDKKKKMEDDLHLNNNLVNTDQGKRKDDQCKNSGIYCFSGIDIIQENLTQKRVSAYECVLIDFGMNGCHMDYAFCSKILYVGDMRMHTIAAIRETIAPDASVAAGIILRDFISCKLKAGYLISKMKKEYDMTKIWILPFNREDMKTRILMETDKRIPVIHESEGMRELIYSLLLEVIPELSQREYKRKMHQKAKVWKRSGGR